MSSKVRAHHDQIIAALQAFADNPFRHTAVEQFAKDAGIPTRTLRLVCQNTFGMSPKAYVNLRRLTLAHQMLQRADPKVTSVTQVALFLKFKEMGRFSVNYRRHFGCSPSTTLKAK